MIRFDCPYCRASLDVAEHWGGQKFTCPACEREARVPKSPRAGGDDSYDLQDEEAPAPTPALPSVEEIVAATEETVKKKKRRRPRMEWHLFVGGFGFPWSLGAFPHWLLLTLWGIVAGYFIHTAIGLGLGGQGLGNLATAIFGLLATGSAGVVGLACLAVATIHGLTILLETTSGNDRIEHWPEIGLFVDWIGDLWFVINTAALSTMLGFGLRWLFLDGVEPRWMPVAGVVFLLFPILLLCVLESDSALVPFSLSVLESVWQRGVAWLAFYVQAGILLAIAAALAAWLSTLEPSWLMIPSLAGLFAAVVMIYFRLLGRLAYYCSVEPEMEEIEE